VSGTPPQNPNIDPVELMAEAKTLYDIMYAFANQKNVPDYASTHAAATTAFKHVTIPTMVGKVAGTILNLIAEIAAGCLTALESAKEQSGSGFQDLISAGLADLFGTQINLSGAGQAGGSGNPKTDAAQTGNAIFNNFLSMFGGLNPIEPGQGLANAKQFLGFGTNFAVVTAFLGIIGGLVPEIHLDELKLIGEEVHHALGLGRLTHTALTPLVRNLIAKPLDLYLKYQLRPDRLAEGQIVRALKAGQLDTTTAQQMLAEKGYRDSDIALLIEDLAQKLAAGELFTLVRNGDLTLDQAIAKLTDTGMDSDNVKLQFKALDEAKADTQVGGILSDLESAYTDGFIDQPTFNGILAKLPLSDSEEQMYRLKVGSHQERPRKRISFAQLKTGIVDAIVDFTYMDTWLAAEGYSPDDQNILSYEILQALKTAEDKITFKEYKANILRKAGKPVPPWLQ
jgi:hypothetical protein